MIRPQHMVVLSKNYTSNRYVRMVQSTEIGWTFLPAPMPMQIPQR
jgi:hypothetical protein